MTVLGIGEIKRRLPHRHPMLLLDRVLELVPGEQVRAVKTITGGEPCYRELADDAVPVGCAYPPALLVESWCQCGALLADERTSDTVALLGGLAGVRFAQPAYPGDVLEHRARTVRRFPDTWIVTGETVVGTTPVLRIGEAVLAARPTNGFRSDTGVIPAGLV